MTYGIFLCDGEFPAESYASIMMGGTLIALSDSVEGDSGFSIFRSGATPIGEWQTLTVDIRHDVSVIVSVLLSYKYW